MWVSRDAKRSALRPLHLKQIARTAIIISAEPGDGAELARVNTAVRIEQRIIDMHHHDFADDEVRGDWPIADGHDLPNHALHVDGRLRQPWRLDLQRWQRVKPREFDFAFLRWNFFRRKIDLLRQRFDRCVEHEFAIGFNISKCVLLRTIAPQNGRENNNRGIGTESIEKAKRCQVHDTSGVDGCHPRNRPWRYDADEEVVDVEDGGLGDVEDHGAMESFFGEPLSIAAIARATLGQ